VITTSRPKRLEWADGRLKVRVNGMEKLEEGTAYIGMLYKYLAIDKKAGRALSICLGETELVDGEYCFL